MEEKKDNDVEDKNQPKNQKYKNRKGGNSPSHEVIIMRDIQKEIEEIKLRNIANELAGLPLEAYPDELPETAENAPVAVHEPVNAQTTITSTESHTEADLSWDDMMPEQDSESDYVRPKRTREERLAILAKVNGKSKPAGSQPNPNAAKIKRFQKIRLMHC